MEIDLTNSELFKSFTEFDVDDLNVDLHNEFDCDAIKFSGSTKELTLLFKANEFNKRAIAEVYIQFKDCSITAFDLEVVKAESRTIDMMYRSRFEKNGQLHEISKEGLFYYYVNFYDGLSFEVLAREVKALINNCPSAGMGFRI